MSASARESERGQILVIMVLVVVSVLLGVAAVAVDLGNGQVQKQRLQNAADAAALAGAYEWNRGGDAIAAAQASLSSSGITADMYGANPPTTNLGLGTNLTRGIEVSDGVRVALSRDVNTFFGGILGRNTLRVAARAHAKVASQGVLPIAIKRFSDGDTRYALGSNGNPTTVNDYLRPAGSDSIGPGAWPDIYSSPSPEASDANPGRTMAILGQDAQANVANGNMFRFWVAPDVRNLTTGNPQPLFIKPIEGVTSIQTLKDVESSYFLNKGYNGPPPYVGQQIGTINGVDTSMAVAAMKQTFLVNDRVTAMVYDGTVYNAPAFVLTLDQTVKTKATIQDESEAITFAVTIDESGSYRTSPGPGVQLSVTGLESWAEWKFEPGGSPNTPLTVGVSAADVPLTLKIWKTNPSPGGARTAMIRAVDSFNNVTRSASATVVVGSVESFSVSCSEAFKAVDQGGSDRFNLDVRGWNGYSENVAVTVDGITTISGTPASGIGVSLSNSNPQARASGTTVRANVTVDSLVPTGLYVIKLRFDDADNSADDQYIELLLKVEMAGNASQVSQTTSVVYVLGYASFIIDSYTTNTAYAHAVSGLRSTPEDLDKGMLVRLVGWYQ